MEKLKDKIERYINKTGVIRTPAYFIKDLFNDIVNYLNDIKIKYINVESIVKDNKKNIDFLVEQNEYIKIDFYFKDVYLNNYNSYNFNKRWFYNLYVNDKLILPNTNNKYVLAYSDLGKITIDCDNDPININKAINYIKESIPIQFDTIDIRGVRKIVGEGLLKSTNANILMHPVIKISPPFKEMFLDCTSYIDLNRFKNDYSTYEEEYVDMTSMFNNYKSYNSIFDFVSFFATDKKFNINGTFANIENFIIRNYYWPSFYRITNANSTFANANIIFSYDYEIVFFVEQDCSHTFSGATLNNVPKILISLKDNAIPTYTNMYYNINTDVLDLSFCCLHNIDFFNIFGVTGLFSGYEIINKFNKLILSSLYPINTNNFDIKFINPLNIIIPKGSINYDFLKGEKYTVTEEYLSGILDIYYSILICNDRLVGTISKYYSDKIAGYFISNEEVEQLLIPIYQRDENNNITKIKEDVSLGGNEVLFQNILTTTIESEAILDFNGESNTLNIIDSINDDNSIINQIHLYKFKNFIDSENIGECYIPALGELINIFNSIPDYLPLVTGLFISSTQYDANHMWGIDNTKDFKIVIIDKNEPTIFFPVTKGNINKLINI